jgi:hypothetical protein
MTETITIESQSWSYRPGLGPHYQGQVYDEETGKTLAISYDDEGGARARLIAALPDLVKVCNTPDSLSGEYGPSILRDAAAELETSNSNMADYVRLWADEMDAVITKAGGA